MQLIKGKKSDKIWLSPTAVGGLHRCPRCFWLQYRKGIRQPEGIVSRLANRFDVVIKKYFDIYRQTNELPPMIAGKVDGHLENPFNEIYFYHHNDKKEVGAGKYGYYGKLDECLVGDNDMYTPVDHKTSSSDPRTKDTLEAYQNQLDSYAFLLEANSKKTSGVGHLIYFFPEHHDKLHEGFKFLIHIVTLKTNPAAAKKKFLEAVKVLEGVIPSPAEDCPFCGWYDRVGKELNA